MSTTVRGPRANRGSLGGFVWLFLEFIISIEIGSFNFEICSYVMIILLCRKMAILLSLKILLENLYPFIVKFVPITFKISKKY